MPPIKKTDLLECCEQSTLKKLAQQFELPVRANAAYATLHQALMAKRSIKLERDILPVLKLPELKAACEFVGLAHSGAKALLLARLAGQSDAAIKSQIKQQTGKQSKQNKQTVNKAAPNTAAASHKRANQRAVTQQIIRRQEPMTNQNEQEFLNSLEKKLWTSANKLLPSLDASQYKHVLLGLVFIKYISDAFDIRRQELTEQFKNANSDYYLDPADFGGADSSEYAAEIEEELEQRDYYAEANVFWVPQPARWEFLQNQNKVVIAGELNVGGKKIRSVGQLIDNALECIEVDNPKLKGVLNKRYTQLQIDQAKLGELIDLVATIPFVHESLNSKDILGHVYEYMLGQFALAEGKKGGQFYTPKSIVSLIVQMLEPFKGRVYDPAMGSGGFFVQTESFINAHKGSLSNDRYGLGDVSIYGQEYNHTTWQLAAMNMAIRGIDFNFGKEPASSYTNDQHPDLRADFVMANPPFNMKEWDTGVDDNDPRWVYGRPPTGNANFAWLQHMLYHTAPNGSLGLLLANGSMSSNTNNEGAIRQKLIEEDLVECMVALPGQLFTNTQIPACIWFLSKNKKARASAAGRAFSDRRGKVLFIDARNLGYMKDRVLRDFTQDDLNHVTETFHNWQVGEGYEDEAGFCKSAELAELQKHDYVLTPGRYVGAAAEEDDGEPFAEKMARLTGQLKTQFDESDRLEAEIKKNLAGLGYEL